MVIQIGRLFEYGRWEMKKEDVKLLKEMKKNNIKKEDLERIFTEYQKEEKDFWCYKKSQRITALYIETMRDIISGGKNEEYTNKKNVELGIEYEIGDIFNMNYYINYKEESNFFHPAMIVHKKDDFIYISIGTSAIDSKKAFHHSTNKSKDKKYFLIKSFETKFKDVSLSANTVFVLENIQAINITRLKRSQFIGTVKNRESILSALENYYKNFF